MTYLTLLKSQHTKFYWLGMRLNYAFSQGSLALWTVSWADYSHLAWLSKVCIYARLLDMEASLLWTVWDNQRIVCVGRLTRVVNQNPSSIKCYRGHQFAWLTLNQTDLLIFNNRVWLASWPGLLRLSCNKRIQYDLRKSKRKFLASRIFKLCRQNRW